MHAGVAQLLSFGYALFPSHGADMIERFVFIAFFSLFFLPFPASAQEGRLQRIRAQVHASDDSDARKGNDPDGGCRDFLSEIFTDEFGTTILATIAAPFTLPRTWLDDHSSREMFFPRFPYEHCF